MKLNLIHEFHQKHLPLFLQMHLLHFHQIHLLHLHSNYLFLFPLPHIKIGKFHNFKYLNLDHMKNESPIIVFLSPQHIGKTIPLELNSVLFIPSNKFCIDRLFALILNSLLLVCLWSRKHLHTELLFSLAISFFQHFHDNSVPQEVSFCFSLQISSLKFLCLSLQLFLPMPYFLSFSFCICPLLASVQFLIFQNLLLIGSFPSTIILTDLQTYEDLEQFQVGFISFSSSSV